MKGELLKNKYLLLQTLGQNSFSETYLAKDRRWLIPRRYIIKKFRPILGNSQVTEMQRWFYQEASVLKRLSGKNPQIPRLYEYFMDGENFFLVREWIDGLTLEQQVQRQGKLSPREVEQLLKSILTCLKYIHNSGIIYGQLTPSSIILRPSRSGYLPVLIYFGGAKELKTIISQSSQYYLVGSHQPQYLAPEQEVGESGYASDLYSLGLTAIYLLTGKTPAELPLASPSKRLLWQQELSESNIHLARVIDRAISPQMQLRFATAGEMLDSLNSPPVNLALPVTNVEPPRSKSFLTSDFKIIAVILGSGLSCLLVVFALLNFDTIQFSRNQWGRLVQHSQVNHITPESNSGGAINNRIPTFKPGVAPRQITKYLGEPRKKNQEQKLDGQVLFYPDLLPNQVDLAYLIDHKTDKIHRVEVWFADAVELATISKLIRQLLGTNYSANIEQNISQVYFDTSDRLTFELKDLSGEVRRDAEQKIYFSVWEK